MQQRQLEQGIDGRDARTARVQSRAAHREHTVPHELARSMAAVVTVAKANREVDRLSSKIKNPGLGNHLNMNVRMLFAEARQSRE